MEAYGRAFKASGIGAAAIELTLDTSPVGSRDNLRGRVWHVEPGRHEVAVVIKVSGGWWARRRRRSRPS